MKDNFIKLEEILQDRPTTISVAESCTGGNLSALLTSKSGSSNFFNSGYITYSNEAKITMLGVNSTTIKNYGAVSEQTVKEMVSGVIANSASDIGVAITGIAGPTGGSKSKPVGMVCFGFCIFKDCFSTTEHFTGDRENIIESSINFVIDRLIYELSK